MFVRWLISHGGLVNLVRHPCSLRSYYTLIIRLLVFTD